MPRHIRRFFYVLLVFTLMTENYAQHTPRDYLLETTISLPTVNVRLLYNHKEKTFVALARTHFYQLSDQRGAAWDSISYQINELPEGTDMPYYQVIHLDNHDYLVAKGGGYVLEFKDSSLIRVDKSFDHKNQSGSVQFPFDHRILSYGGYGMFTYKDFITEFTLSSREWNLYDVVPGQRIPPGRYSPIAHFNSSTSQLYIASGRRNKYTYTHHDLRITLTDVWRLDLDTKRWTKLGYLRHPADFEKLYWWTFQLGNQIYYISLNPNQMIGYDFKNNTRTVWEDHNSILDRIQDVPPVLIEPENYLLCITTFANQRSGYQLGFIRQEDLLHRKVSDSRLYVNGLLLLKTGLIILLVLALTYFIYRAYNNYRRTTNVLILRKKDGRLKWHGRIIPLADDQLRLLKFLAGEDNYVSNVRVSELFYHPGESEDVVKKRKMATINHINQKIQEFTGLSGTLILERQGMPDRRFKEYALNKEMVITG